MSPSVFVPHRHASGSLHTRIDKLLGLGCPSSLLGDLLLHSRNLFIVSYLFHSYTSTLDEFGGKAKILGQFCWLRNQVAGDDDVESCGGVGQETYQVRRLDVEGKLLLLEVLEHGEDGQLMVKYLLSRLVRAHTLNVTFMVGCG